MPTEAPLRLVPAAAPSRAPTAAAGSAGPRPRRASARARASVILLIGDLAVLLGAGLQLDRALTLALDNIEDAVARGLLADLLRQVREGAPLSRAMAERPELFPPEAIAITEAGEANGRLDAALARAAAMLGDAAELRRTIGAALTYPVILGVIAIGVILMMLLFVVPQFESLFQSQADRLPAQTVAVMTASRLLRDDWYWLVGAIAAGVLLARQLAGRPGQALARDRLILRLPLFGPLVQRMDTARFARSAGSLLESGVPLPHAFALSERTLKNRAIRAGAATVAAGIRQGGGIAAPLAAANIFPRIAIGFIRTGEESSQLGPMLTRLADVLERDVRARLARIIAIATPAITVLLGGSVAFIIAAVMTAILGFNDLALAG